MHPALSVIIFTVASGAGFGMLALFGTLLGVGLLAPAAGPDLGVLALALALVTAGLVSSSFHLGHPERAWRALSQWRSSWLSREGVAALASYLPVLLLALALVQGGRGAMRPLALLTAAMAVVTVAATGMIYRSLRPVHQWHNGYVVPVYLVLAAATGGLWLDGTLRLEGGGSRLVTALALAALLAAAALKLAYWRFIDRSAGPATAASATGLGALGRVRLFEQPHSGSNYLLREMGFAVARKHVRKLRRLALGLGLALPVALALLALAAGGAAAIAASLAAALLATFGALVERWLFFAEARHTVTLYYGAERA